MSKIIHLGKENIPERTKYRFGRFRKIHVPFNELSPPLTTPPVNESILHGNTHSKRNAKKTNGYEKRCFCDKTTFFWEP